MHLRRGRVVSCGCWAADKARARAMHGLSNSRTYTAWRSMLNRCRRPADSHYADYGGRGIQVCALWDKFMPFLADMGQCPDGMQIERKDVNGNYEPSNCVWATRKAQANNTRRNVRMTYMGESLTLKQVSEKCGVNYKLLYWRVRVAKWPLEKAVQL